MSKIKKILFLLLGLTLIASFSKTVSAAEPDLLFGESHDYSVIMRGNGESIVYARINLTNNQDAALTSYKFEIPGLNVDEIVGYQIELPRYCAQYDYTQTTVNPGVERPCLRYQEPDYTSGYYGTENTEYHKLNFTNDGNKYSAELPKSVKPGESTAFVLSYTGKGYVDESFGLYKFNFETLKVDSRIKSATVALDVDSDFILEGQRAKVNYQAETNSNLLSGASMDSANKAEFGRVIQSIGSSGAIVKDAQNLAAGETFSVKGKYAASAWRLNLSKIIAGIVIILLIVAFLIWLSKRIKKKKASQPQAAGSDAKSPVQTTASHESLVNPLFIGAGFLSSAVIVIATYLLNVFIQANQADAYMESDQTADIIYLIIGLLFYMLAIFGPAIWLAARKKSWHAFVYILFWVFAWLIVFAALYQWALKDVFYSEPEPQPYPILRDCINC